MNDPETMIQDKNHELVDRYLVRTDVQITEVLQFNLDLLEAIASLKAKCHENADKAGALQATLDGINERVATENLERIYERFLQSITWNDESQAIFWKLIDKMRHGGTKQ